VLIQRNIHGHRSEDSALSHCTDSTAFSVFLLSASSTPAIGEWVISNRPSGVRPDPPPSPIGAIRLLPFKARVPEVLWRDVITGYSSAHVQAR